MKYDFLAITDHYFLTDLSKHINDEQLILFQGVEYKTSKKQTLGINITTYDDDKDDFENHEKLFSKVQAQGGLNIICHPHGFGNDYWPAEELLKLDNFMGIEIYNNNVRFDNKGRAVATDIWDILLSAGKKVWGFANDDMHVFSRCGGAFNIVLAKEKSRFAILEALKNGSFYCSSGIFLDEIGIRNNSIYLKLKHENIPAKFKFIGENGKIIYQCFGNEASYEFSNCTSSYIRVEARREDGSMAWSQPFYL